MRLEDALTAGPASEGRATQWGTDGGCPPLVKTRGPIQADSGLVRGEGEGWGWYPLTLSGYLAL